MSSENIFLNLFAWEFFKDARIIKAIFNLVFCFFSLKALTLNRIGWKGSGMENYGDETLWEMLAHPKSMGGGKNDVVPNHHFSYFFHPKLFFSLASVREMRGSDILSWNLRAPLWHYLKLSFLFSLSVFFIFFSLRHEASSSSEGEREIGGMRDDTAKINYFLLLSLSVSSFMKCPGRLLTNI